MLNPVKLCMVYENDDVQIWTGYQNDISVTYYKYVNKIGDDWKNTVLICKNNVPTVEFELPK